VIGINVYQTVSLPHHVTRVKTTLVSKGDSEFVPLDSDDGISETSVDIQLRTRQYIPEDSELQ
jgi:hypothetical protein